MVLVPELEASLADYLGLLAHWNRTINLTGLPLEPPSNETIDRLILEPVAAARHLRPTDRLVVDIGSGGGSPAIPMKLAVPVLQMVLIESRVRKAAFLREVIRHLGIEGMTVENERLEQLAARPELSRKADLVMTRAVRVDEAFLKNAAAFLKPDGRMFWLTTSVNGLDVPRPFEKPRMEALLPSAGSRLAVLTHSL